MVSSKGTTATPQPSGVSGMSLFLFTHHLGKRDDFKGDIDAFLYLSVMLQGEIRGGDSTRFFGVGSHRAGRDLRLAAADDGHVQRLHGAAHGAGGRVEPSIATRPSRGERGERDSLSFPATSWWCGADSTACVFFFFFFF